MIVVDYGGSYFIVFLRNWSSEIGEKRGWASKGLSFGAERVDKEGYVFFVYVLVCWLVVWLKYFFLVACEKSKASESFAIFELW